MASRRNDTSLPDLLLDMLTVLPWWAGLVAVPVTYLLFRFLLPAILSLAASTASAPAHDPAHGLNRSLLQGLSGVPRVIAPLVTLFVCLIWVIALFKRTTNARRLDRQTGPESIDKLSWLDFEKLLGEVFRRQGYAVEHTGSPPGGGGGGGDGGIDLTLKRDGLLTLVQCKHWKVRRVGPKYIRDLRGAMANANATRGIVVTSGSFTAQAEDFAKANAITLIAGPELAELIRSVQALQATTPSSPPAGATPDAAPACPSCGSPMVMRTARKGPQAGSRFWGCTRYPQCYGKQELGMGAR